MNLPTIDFSGWLPKIWEVVRWFLSSMQIWVMIVVAAFVVVGILSIIAWLMGGGEEEDKEYDHEEY